MKRFNACPVGKILKPKESCRIHLIVPREKRDNFKEPEFLIKYKGGEEKVKTLNSDLNQHV